MARRMADAQDDIHVFGHDLLNAYWQWPVRHPPVPQRHVPTHRTWVDAVVPLGHVLWGHSVGVELQPGGGRLAAPHAHAAPTSRCALQGQGLQGPAACQSPRPPRCRSTRPARRSGTQPHPTTSGETAPRHRPGVGVQLPDVVRSCTTRGQALVPHSGCVRRSGACRLTTARSHNTQTGDDESLSTGLRSALYALDHILNDIKPRFLPNVVPLVLQAVIFADAYVKTGEQRHKAGHVPQDVPLPAHARDDNGWGYVVRIGEMVYFDHGTTPRSVLDAMTSRRAFIYALEVYAQLMAFFALAERLRSDWLAFIDNTAGEAALKKGYGKDAFVNGMLPRSGARQHGEPGDHSSPGLNPRQTWPTPCHVGTSPAHTARVGQEWPSTPTPSPRSWSRRPRTPSTPRTPWTTSSLSSTEPARSGGQRAPGGCAECALPGASQFCGRDVGSRARSASSHPKRRSALASAQ